MFWAIFWPMVAAILAVGAVLTLVMWWLDPWLFNRVGDRMLKGLLTTSYTQNLGSMISLLRRANPQTFYENMLRSQKSSSLSRPMGTPLVFSHWEQLVFNPAQLAKFPTEHRDHISLKTVIGRHCDKPLKLDIPILIAAMSYGGALSLKTKLALAYGANLAGTATNTGEAYLPEERQAAKKLIVQYHRGTWPLSAQNHSEYLETADAIEIQIGQGAQAAAAMGTAEPDPEMRRYFGLKEGEPAVIASRLQGIDSAKDFIKLVRNLKQRYAVPIGIKIAPSGWLNDDLDVLLEAEPTFIVLDGGEGGTHGGPPILQDDFGLPTMAAVAWTDEYLKDHGVRHAINLIAAGGLRTPGEFLKAMAIGADAIYIGFAALMAMASTVGTQVLPYSPPEALFYQSGRYKNRLDVNRAANGLATFLNSAADELRYGIQSLGKHNVHDVNRHDLIALDPWTAEIAGVRSLIRPWVAQSPGYYPAPPEFSSRNLEPPTRTH